MPSVLRPIAQNKLSFRAPQDHPQADDPKVEEPVFTLSSTCHTFGRLRLLRPLIKRCRYDFRLHALATNLDQNFVPNLAHPNQYIRQRNVLLEERRVRSAGHVSSFTARSIQDAIAV